VTARTTTRPRDVAFALLRHGVPAGLGALSVAVTARTLGPDTLGFWNILGTIAFLLGLADLGLSGAVLRAAAADRPGEALSIARWSAWRGAQIGVPVALLAAFELTRLADHLAPAAQRGALAAIPVALGAGLLLALSQGPRAYLHGRGHIADLAVARIAGAVTQAVGTIGLVRWLGALGVAVGYALSIGVEVALVAAALRRNRVPLVPLDATARAETIALARGMLVGNLAVAAFTRVDLLLLEVRFDLGVLAAYGTTSRLVDQLYTAVKQLGFALVPRLGLGATDRGKIAAKGAVVLGVLGAVVLAPMLLEGPAVIRLLAGPSLDPAVVGIVAPWLALAAIAAGCVEIPETALVLGERGSVVGRLLSVFAALNLALTALAVSRGQLWLAAAATFVGNGGLAVVVLDRARKELRWTNEEVRALVLPPFAAVGGAWATHALLLALPFALPALLRVALLPPCALAFGAAMALVTARRSRLLAYAPPT
jgi:O-antigen/teichoic acid export membrane protein